MIIFHLQHGKSNWSTNLIHTTIIIIVVFMGRTQRKKLFNVGNSLDGCFYSYFLSEGEKSFDEMPLMARGDA